MGSYGPDARPVEQRFWEKVEKTETCWNWKGSTDRYGYGTIRENYKHLRVHRLSYHLANGQIPEGRVIDHICHNRACVNPQHLRIATAKQNQENLTGAYSNSKSGVRGVIWSKSHKKWRARVCHNGVANHAGLFDTIEEAAEAARELRNRLFTHNDRDRIEAS